MPETVKEDYWAACTNPGCRHHQGEGCLQSSPTWLRRRADKLVCVECGAPYMTTADGVTRHLTPDGGIDFDRDTEHVAFGPYEEQPTREADRK